MLHVKKCNRQEAGQAPNSNATRGGCKQTEGPLPHADLNADGLIEF